MNMHCSLAIGIALKLRQNWRSDAARLPAPARLVGFTLIELSIVLVIIGLIVGGVLVGQDLIRAAQIHNTASQVEKIKISMNLFKLKINQIPGDSNKMWAIYGTQCAANEGRCNGNNNRLIGQELNHSTHGTRDEDKCVFRHLAIAGVWDGPTDSATCDGGAGLSQATIDAYPGVIPKTIDDKYLHVAAWQLFQVKFANSITITAPSINFAGA